MENHFSDSWRGEIRKISRSLIHSSRAAPSLDYVAETNGRRAIKPRETKWFFVSSGKPFSILLPLSKKTDDTSRFLARLGPGLLSRPIIGVSLLPHANQFTSAIERSVLVSWPFAACPSSAMLFAHYLSPPADLRAGSNVLIARSASVSLAVISLISRKGED